MLRGSLQVDRRRARAAHREVGDPEVVQRIGSMGIHPERLPEDANRGHTEAVAFAQREALAREAWRFLTVPGDVPCVTPGEVQALSDALREAPGAAFVPSVSGFGTNAVLLAPPDVMPLKFGEPSFDNHLEAARQRGLSPAILTLPGLGLDIDSPEDLDLLLQRGPDTRSARLLRQWDLQARRPAP